MKKLKIGSIAKIGIYLHWTFTLLVGGIFVFYLYQGSSVSAALIGVGLVLALFTCVVLHELGHALTALHYGVATRDITIYPIGGVARLERIPEEPVKEFWIALAGPAVNAAIAAVLFIALYALGDSLSPIVLLQPDGGSFWATLMWLNVILVGFNLLPAFPMDGGRILRALLATRLDYAKASHIAANIGQAMAVLFGVIGFLVLNPFLIVIALFVYFGARQESQQALMRAVTRGVPVRQVMLTRFGTLSPSDTLDVAVDELLSGSDQDFPVADDGRVVGVLTRRQLMKALAEQGREARISDIIEPECFTVEDTMLLEDAFARMNAAQCSTVPVVRGGRLVGLLTLENVGELMMVAAALGRAGRSGDVESVLAAHGAGGTS
ncbi:MAG: site-2 protease family protein [Rhodothermales bacterium]